MSWLDNDTKKLVEGLGLNAAIFGALDMYFNQSSFQETAPRALLNSGSSFIGQLVDRYLFQNIYPASNGVMSPILGGLTYVSLGNFTKTDERPFLSKILLSIGADVLSKGQFFNTVSPTQYEKIKQDDYKVLISEGYSDTDAKTISSGTARATVVGGGGSAPPDPDRKKTPTIIWSWKYGVDNSVPLFDLQAHPNFKSVLQTHQAYPYIRYLSLFDPDGVSTREEFPDMDGQQILTRMLKDGLLTRNPYYDPSAVEIRG